MSLDKEIGVALLHTCISESHFMRFPFLISCQSKPLRRLGLRVGASLACMVLPFVAIADCTWSQVSQPTRQVITCGASLTIEREAETSMTIFERSGGAPPERIEIGNGAILIEVAPGSPATQIRTPHAIAAVRGTIYVVDAGTDSSSVFVLQGQVDVRGTEADDSVTLEAGQGVDVTSEQLLEVSTWSARRKTDLLARFGR
jgi:hypothetical protein